MPNDICIVERLDGSTAAYKRLYLITAILSAKETASLKSSGALSEGLFKGMEEGAVGGGAGQYDVFDWADLPEYGAEEMESAPMERKGKGKIGPAPLTYEEYMAALAAPPEEESPIVETAAPVVKTAAELTEADIENI